MGKTYYDFARGIDLRPVEAVYIRKSVGCEHTLERDVCRTSSVIIELYHVVTDLVERLSRQQFVGNTLTLKIKFHDFTQVSRSHTTNAPLTSLKTILPLAKELLKKVDYRNRPIRLIGLSVSNSHDSTPTIHAKTWEQLPLIFPPFD